MRGLFQRYKTLTKKIVTVTGNKSGEYSPQVLVEPDSNSQWYFGGLTDVEFSFLNYQIYVTHYIMKNGGGNFPATWELIGIINEESKTIAKETKSNVFTTGFTPKTFNLTRGVFDKLILKQTGVNVEKYPTFCLSRVDFFGSLISKDNHIYTMPYSCCLPTCLHGIQSSHSLFFLRMMSILICS